jgi:uncharacterized paraquat-inducible protein A
MEEEDFVCEVCDSEFTVKHYEEDEVAFCPFCGETLFKDDDDVDSDDWEDEDEE